MIRTWLSWLRMQQPGMKQTLSSPSKTRIRIPSALSTAIVFTKTVRLLPFRKCLRTHHPVNCPGQFKSYSKMIWLTKQSLATELKLMVFSGAVDQPRMVLPTVFSKLKLWLPELKVCLKKNKNQIYLRLILRISEKLPRKKMSSTYWVDPSHQLLRAQLMLKKVFYYNYLAVPRRFYPTELTSVVIST